MSVRIRGEKDSCINEVIFVFGSAYTYVQLLPFLPPVWELIVVHGCWVYKAEMC
jgi:hypothetical protein